MRFAGNGRNVPAAFAAVAVAVSLAACSTATRATSDVPATAAVSTVPTPTLVPEADLIARETFDGFVTRIDALESNYGTEHDAYVAAVSAKDTKDAIARAESLADTCATAVTLASGDVDVDAAWHAYGKECVSGWKDIAKAHRTGSTPLLAAGHNKVQAADQLFSVAIDAAIARAKVVHPSPSNS